MTKDSARIITELQASKLAESLDRAADDLAASFAGIPFPVPSDESPTIEHARAALIRAERRYTEENFPLDDPELAYCIDDDIDPVVTVATMLCELLAVAPPGRVYVGHVTKGEGDDDERDRVHEVTYAIESFPPGPNLPSTTMTTTLKPAGVDSLFKSIATGPRIADVPSPVSPADLRRVVRLWQKFRARQRDFQNHPGPDALDTQCASFANWLHSAANVGEGLEGDAQVERLGAVLDELDEL